MLRRIRGRYAAIVAVCIIAPALSGCQSALGTSAFGTKPTPLLNLPETRFYSSDEALRYGKEYFRQGDYGRAEASYRRAVELLPQDPEALLGLAASYDRLRRFDLADRAYGMAAPYVGSRAEYYNNLGYSYVLRGDLQQARTYLLKAYEIDPDNPVTANNLAMLKNSVSYPDR